ncbi:uncharacterized protein PHACADRAFT_192793 [Phanerochaete carnosa HHB-10118-sp]|uniref:Uncharacterized protein n=1 Tax=Phanerochaete carnosa (strain HHB-10118-sp) TaxID=650164 RepID=K5V4U8_PHACS|nr:uncharacterized protein PHACADRAFT_192793 [Phanerochaete carnosa HHB-10118-sp]EKM57656.1 hypothetical protein PHACADRAFT_192793 [Phanerochaete carnosa HHB-10118-sp]
MPREHHQAVSFLAMSSMYSQAIFGGRGALAAEDAASFCSGSSAGFRERTETETVIGAFMGLEARAHSVTIISLGGSAVCDAVISVTMAYLGHSHPGDPRNYHSDRPPRNQNWCPNLPAFCSAVRYSRRRPLRRATLARLLRAHRRDPYSNSLFVPFNTRMHIRGGRNWTSYFHTGAPARASVRSAGHAAAAVVSLGAPGGVTTMSSFGGVHVHEQVWVHGRDGDEGANLESGGERRRFRSR